MDNPTSRSRAGRPILVVDDDAKIVRLVRTYLEREGFAVIEAADGTDALEQIRLHEPRLVVLDLMLPRTDGLAVLRAIRRGGETPLVVLSARGTTRDRITGLGEGADDYLSKPFSPAELVLRVKRVLARASPRGQAPPDVPLQLDDLVVDRARHGVAVGGRTVDVTTVEFRLLCALLEADGRVLSRDQLLDAVYGVDADAILDRTIDVHIGRLRDKLGDRAIAPRYVDTVRGAGYRAAYSGSLDARRPARR